MQDEIMGWPKSWIGPKDYRCIECHFGFMPDEHVYLDKNGIPFHEHCVSRQEFSNRFLKGGSVITPSQRANIASTGQKPPAPNPANFFD